jgi:hypothetical protein
VVIVSAVARHALEVIVSAVEEVEADTTIVGTLVVVAVAAALLPATCNTNNKSR